MSLASLQRAVARAVMQPLTRDEHMRPTGPDGQSMRRYAARYIKPNDRLTSFERLEIYNRQYWFRVLGCLNEDFPGLRAILGERRFEDMCRAYLVDYPSRSFTLRNLGSRLETWLRHNPKWVAGKKQLALDMARLEWADIEAFDRESEPVLKMEELDAASAASLKLQLQPYIQLLRLHYPVDDLVLQVREDQGDAGFASNAVNERRKRKKVRTVAALKPQDIFLVVHRVDYSVYFRRMDREEFALLESLRMDKTISRAIDVAFRGSEVPEFERGTYVRQCFETWATLGWFCEPRHSGRNSKNEKGKA